MKNYNLAKLKSWFIKNKNLVLMVGILIISTMLFVWGLNFVVILMFVSAANRWRIRQLANA